MIERYIGNHINFYNNNNNNNLSGIKYAVVFS